MRVSRIAALAALYSTCLTATAAQAGSACWMPEEQNAAQVRGFQTMLMVAALHCRSQHPFAADAYNRFVTRQRASLDRHGAALKAHFDREDATDARGAYDRYNTMLANEYSRDFDSADACWAVASLADEATQASADDLLRLAASYSQPPALDSQCRPAETAVAAAPPAPEVAAAVAPVPEIPAVAPAPLIAAAATEDALPTKVLESSPVVAPMPETEQSALVQVSPAPAASKEEALRAAIAALQAATAALEAITVADSETAEGSKPAALLPSGS